MKGAKRRALVRIAWWAILLGVVMEGLLLAIQLARAAPLQPLAEGLGKVTWSLIVCGGVGLGKVLSEDKPFWTGLAGMFGAPAAFTAAQAVQRIVTELTTAVESGPITPTLIGIGALRGVEYLVLGALLAGLSQRKARPAHHLLTGLLVGLVAGGIVLLLTPATAGTVAGLLGWAVNELAFPLGCAAVLYGGGVVSGALEQR